MADNTTLNPGTGGDVIATDDIAGVKYQWVKLAFGADGAVTPVTAAAGLPVSGEVDVNIISGGVTDGFTVSQTLNGAAQTITMLLDRAPMVAIQFVDTSFIGTIVSEGSVDGGTTWGTVLTTPLTAPTSPPSAQITVATLGAEVVLANTAGLTHFRLRVLAYTSGSCVATVRSSNTQANIQTISTATPAVGSLTTGTLSSLGGTLVVPTLGAPAVAFQFTANTLSGTTILSEGSADDGVTWGTVISLSSGSQSLGAGSQVAQNVNPQYMAAGGLTHVRFRVSVYGSGSATVVARPSATPTHVSLMNGSIAAITASIVPGTGATNLGKAEDATHTTGDTGVMALAVQNSARAVFNSGDGDYSPIGVNRVGAVGVTVLSHASSAEAPTTLRVTSAASTNSTNVKSTNANLYSVVAANGTAAAKFLKFYNKTTAPTVGTDVPLLVVAIPPGDTKVLDKGLLPQAFNLGLGYAITGAMPDGDTTAVAAGDVSFTIQYV